MSLLLLLDSGSKRRRAIVIFTYDPIQFQLCFEIRRVFGCILRYLLSSDDRVSTKTVAASPYPSRVLRVSKREHFCALLILFVSVFGFCVVETSASDRSSVLLCKQEGAS